MSLLDSSKCPHCGMYGVPRVMGIKGCEVCGKVVTGNGQPLPGKIEDYKD